MNEKCPSPLPTPLTPRASADSDFSAASTRTTYPPAAQGSSRGPSWWTGEDAICLSALPRHLPHRHDGRRISVATCYRYALSGVCGVRLRRFRVGSGWATTLQEVSRWQRAVTLAKGGDV